MKRKKHTQNKTLRNLKVWWLLLSTTTSKVLTVLGLGVAVFLIAVGTGTGTSTTTVNAQQANIAASASIESVPAITLLTTEKTSPPSFNSTNVVEILASKKGASAEKKSVSRSVDSTSNETIVIAQSTTQLELEKLVNQAMNQKTEPVEASQPPNQTPEPTSNSTNDQLKALVNQATPNASERPSDNYISTLNAEVETTVVIDEKTAQQPAENAALSNSDRLKLIQDIAKKVAGDDSTTAQNVRYVTVQENDSLWLIAKRVYKDAYQYKLLYQANKDILLNENSLVVGQQLRVPNLN